MKKGLCFAVVHIGELKFFERFFSHFTDEYTIYIVFIRPLDERRKQMEEYCKKQNYAFASLEYHLAGGAKGGRTIPFFSAVWQHYKHTLQCKHFFKEHSISRLVAAKVPMPIQPLFKEANYLGIETRVIQRGHMPPLKSYVKITPPSFLKRIYAFCIDRLNNVADLFLRGPRYAFASSMPDKAGAIGKEGKWVLPERRGYDPEIVEILGSFDHQWTIELKQKITSNNSFRKELLQKYHMDPRKKQILIISGRYQHYIDAREEYTKEEEKEQVVYFENVIKRIRDVFSPEGAQIHFKLHPIESNIYDSYKQYDVELHGNEAKTDELVCLADLYLSYPVTSTNYMVVASGTPALFINFSPLQSLNERAVDFGITNVINDKDMFTTYLADFKAGKLKKQYDTRYVVPNAIDNIIRFIKSS